MVILWELNGDLMVILWELYRIFVGFWYFYSDLWYFMVI